MIQECVDKLSEIVFTASERIGKEIRLWEKDPAAVAEGQIATVQKEMIDFGNEVEQEYHLQNTEFIKKLQNCCELLYCYSCKKLDGEAVLHKLSVEVSGWMAALSKSVVVQDLY